MQTVDFVLLRFQITLIPQVNVAGSRCDVCKGGYFNLDIENEFGCTECFCFGASTACESVGWGLSKVRF